MTVTRRGRHPLRADLARMGARSETAWSALLARAGATPRDWRSAPDFSLRRRQHRRLRPRRGPVPCDRQLRHATGQIAQRRRLRIRSSISCPIVSTAVLAAPIAASSTSTTPFPPDTESRISRVHGARGDRDRQHRSAGGGCGMRARIVAAADEERRRVVRDLHDGAQQRLVHTILMVAQARKALPPMRSPHPSSWPKRWLRRRLRGKSYASLRTASFPRFSPTVACARPSRHSPGGHRCRSRSPCPLTVSLVPSKRRPTSSSPRR